MGESRVRFFEVSGYFLLLLLCGALVYQLNVSRKAAVETALHSFNERQMADSRTVAVNVESTFRQVYQGVRTIARLPAVRNLESEPGLLHDDARVSAQEIYNNLRESLLVSELYIVPADFEPDEIDPLTGEPERPLMTFDQLIVGKHAGSNRALSGSPEIEEIEIYEYREMRRQLDYLQTSYGTEDKVSDLTYPALVSREVITCDNTRYSPSAPDDNDRKGILYSVPYYGSAGRLGGIVTAVILSSVVAELLPSDSYVIAGNKLTFPRQMAAGGSTGSEASAKAEEAAKPAVEASLMPLNFPDLSSQWGLRTSIPYSEFLESDPVRAINARFWAAVATLLAGMTALALSFRWLSHRHMDVEMLNRQLTERIEDRTSALAKATLAAEEANSAKSEFLARISHEIRTPMHAIMSASELLSPSVREANAMRKVEIIRNASQALLELVNQVLDLSAIEHGELTVNVAPFSPAELLHQTCDLLEPRAAEKGLRIRREVDGEMPPLFSSDAARIRQVLINLIGNAVKYTEAGTITVALRPVAPSPDGDDRVVFDIIDTGIGIPDSLRESIFDPFKRGPGAALDPDGSGLGLAISRQLAQKLGGSLELVDHDGPGAHFRLTVGSMETSPQVAAAPMTDPLPRRRQVHRDGRMLPLRVLIAEDNPRMRELIRESVESFGCSVETAENGVDAVLAVERTRFDVVLMDCFMPHLDGLGATKRIRQWEAAQGSQGRAVPIIALTANILSSDRKACLDAGMNDVLTKPFTQDEIFEVMSCTVPTARAGKGEARLVMSDD